MRRWWTRNDERVLRDYYGLVDDTTLAATLGRTEVELRQIARCIGLTLPEDRPRRDDPSRNPKRSSTGHA
jgi:hypothetical protein